MSKNKAKSIKYNYEIKMVSKTKTKITDAENISTSEIPPLTLTFRSGGFVLLNS